MADEYLTICSRDFGYRGEVKMDIEGVDKDKRKIDMGQKGRCMVEGC